MQHALLNGSREKTTPAWHSTFVRRRACAPSRRQHGSPRLRQGKQIGIHIVPAGDLRGNDLGGDAANVMPLPPNAMIAKQPGRSGMAPMVGKPVGLAPNEPHQAKAA